MAGAWRKLHNDEFHNSYFSPSIIDIIKSKFVRLVGHVARIGDIINRYDISVSNIKETDILEDLSIDGRIILTLLLLK